MTTTATKPIEVGVTYGVIPVDFFAAAPASRLPWDHRATMDGVDIIAHDRRHHRLDPRADRDPSSREIESVLIHPDDLDLVYLAAPWGLTISADALAVSRGHRASTNNRHDRWYTQEWDRVAVGGFGWAPGAQARAAAHLRTRAAEGILEAIAAVWLHWRRARDLITDMEPERISDHFRAESVAALTEWALREGSSALARTRQAATAWCETRRDLDIGLGRAGDDMGEVLTVLSHYLAGDLGRDWHVAGYYSSPLTPGLEREQDARLAELDAARRAHEVGEPGTHLSASTLKPLLKRLPGLRSAYAGRQG